MEEASTSTLLVRQTAEPGSSPPKTTFSALLDVPGDSLLQAEGAQYGAAGVLHEMHHGLRSVGGKPVRVQVGAGGVRKGRSCDRALAGRLVMQGRNKPHC
jgi:hypothetical protein